MVEQSQPQQQLTNVVELEEQYQQPELTNHESQQQPISSDIEIKQQTEQSKDGNIEQNLRDRCSHISENDNVLIRLPSSQEKFIKLSKNGWESNFPNLII